MKRYLPHLGILLGVSIAVYALFFSQSEEDRIRELLEKLEEAVAVSPDDTNVVVRAARVRSLFGEIFDKDVRYQIPELEAVSRGRAELAGVAAKAPELWRSATVDLDGLAITVDQAAMGAVAVGPASLNATRHNGTVEIDTRTVSLTLEKVEGEWRVVHMSVSAGENEL
jgi:hypothetical protein